jgi:hypothetical protein
MKSKNYTLTTWYMPDNSRLYYGRWHCRIDFTIALGNTGEAERVANNGLRAAKRHIRNEIIDRNLTNKIENGWQGPVFPKRLAYEVKSNKTEQGSGRLMSLTIAEK